MVRVIVYCGLFAAGIAATLITPFFGAVVCTAAYLLNPSVIIGDESFRFQLWTTAAFLLSYLIHRPQGLEPVAREGFVLRALFVFSGIALLSSFWAVHSSQQAFDQSFEVFKTVLMTVALSKVVTSEAEMATLMTTCLLGVCHAAVAHTFGVRLGYVPNAYGREYGVLPDGQGGPLILFLPIVILTAMLSSTRRERWLSWAILPFVLNSLVVTYRRGVLVALVAEALLLFLLLPKRIVLRTAPVVLAGIGLFVFQLTPASYWARMSTLRAPSEEASANSRLVINDASIRMLIDYPFGVGYRNYLFVSPRYLPGAFLTEGTRSAHNSFFTVACETGIPGFVAWAMAFGGSIWLCRRIRKDADVYNLSRIDIYAMGIEIGLYGWLVGGLFNSDTELDPAYWAVAFAVILTRLRHLGRHEAMADIAETESVRAESRPA